MQHMGAMVDLEEAALVTLVSPASAVILKEASKGPQTEGPHMGMKLQEGAPGTPCNNQ